MESDQAFLEVLRERAGDLVRQIAGLEALRVEYARVSELIRLVESRGDALPSEVEAREGVSSPDDAVMSEVRRLLLDRFSDGATVAELYRSLSDDSRRKMPSANERLGIESLRYRIKRYYQDFDLAYDGGAVKALPLHSNVFAISNRGDGDVDLVNTVLGKPISFLANTYVANLSTSLAPYDSIKSTGFSANSFLDELIKVNESNAPTAGLLIDSLSSLTENSTSRAGNLFEAFASMHESHPAIPYQDALNALGESSGAKSKPLLAAFSAIREAKKA